MAFKQMDKKVKTGKTLNIVATVLIVIMALLLFIALYRRFIIHATNEQLGITDNNTSVSDTVNPLTNIKGDVNVVVAKKSMAPGEVLLREYVEMVTRPAKDVPQNALTSINGIEGKRIKVSKVPNEILLDMDLVSRDEWYDDEDRYLEHKFMPEAIPAVVQIGSIVDIKLLKNDAEDPIVVSKVAVESRTGDVLGFYLNFEEQEYIKEATSEGTLFVTVYAGKSQPPSQVTYKPTYELINTTVPKYKENKTKAENN